MDAAKTESLHKRIFRFLVRLFPLEFRWDYGRDMEHVFEDQRREAASRGGIMGILRLWWETLAGIFTTAPREHWEMLKQDGGYALRIMRKNPGFTAVVVLTLALGIGANTAIFSVINGVLLRPLPYAQGDQLIRLRQNATRAGISDVAFSVKEIADYHEQNQTLSGTAEYHSMSFTLFGQGEAQRLLIGVVSANYFDVMGVKPILGRLFLPGEDRVGADPVLLLTYGYWKNVMGGDPNVVGKTFEMNDRVHTVIGVLPPLPDYPDANQMFMPSSSCPFRSNPRTVENRQARMLSLFARRNPGVPVAQVSADLSTIAHRLEIQYPGDYPKADGYDVDELPIQSEMTGGARTTFLILLGTAGLVLLLTCANVANLTLSRQIRREHELAIRATLGASRARVFRQLLTESTLLAVAGGGLGLLVAAGGISLLVAFAARLTPRTGEIGIDSYVLLFTLAISVLTGVLFGSIPAFSSRQDLAGVMNQGGGRTSGSVSKHRVRNMLVTAQVAISFILLIGAGLMLRTLVKLQEVDPGFRPQNVLSSTVSLNFTKYRDQKLSLAFYENVLDNLTQRPGVQSAAVSLTVPLGNQSGPNDGQVVIEGRPLPAGTPAPKVDFRVVSPNYFRTMGITQIRGRDFTSDDKADRPPVAIVNQSMARHNWGDADPVGQRASADGGKTWITIVGVVGDVKQYGLNRVATDEFYVPLESNSLLQAAILIRTAINPLLMNKEIVKAVHEIDPQQPVIRVMTLEQIRNEWLASPRLTAILITLFAGLALVITLAGISGVMALAVSQRTREIGIRMALGASKATVLMMVLRQGMILVVLG
ncbi:MAG TPA: ABC transporter permease, partial [Candidatus Acidoferrum sp.]|nr:ABC transporter permease [Candidatus Acidoferrum sp.]